LRRYAMTRSAAAIWCRYLVESGDELIRYFELDAYRLDSIINEQAGATTRVDRDDIALTGHERPSGAVPGDAHAGWERHSQ
jgi:hypothetical protein